MSSPPLLAPHQKSLDTPSAVAQPNKVNRGDDKWMKDEDTDYCSRCNIDFHSVKRRKHHCRMCGFVVCDNCSRNRVQLKPNGKKSRVCNECFNQIAPRHMRSYSSRTKIIDNNNNHNPIIHQQATSEEVEEIIERLRETAIREKNEMMNKHESVPSAADSNSSWIRTKSYPERTNTDGTFVEYDVTHKQIKDDDDDDINNNEQQQNNQLFESPAQPLLNNTESRCCSCYIL